MLMTVMEIRVMRMLVPNPRVSVPVAVGLSVWIGRRMVVLVVHIVDVTMLVLDRLMQVLVVMRLGEVQIDTNPHEKCGADQGKSWRLAEQRQRKGCADKWSRREVGASARRSQVAEAKHKHHQTDAIPDESHRRGGGKRCCSRQWRAMTERHREIHCACGHPFIMAICSGSAALSLRVRLLSMPHDTQARTISTPPS